MAKFKIKSMIPIKSFTLKKNSVLKVFSILFFTALSVIILYGLYHGVRKAMYMYRLKTDFYKLQDMGLNVKNYNIKYCKHLKKKFIPKTFKIRTEKKRGEFMNKKIIGFIPDKYIVLDIDANDSIQNANFLTYKIPKDTAVEKTPNGYHYYFENDTGNSVHTYIQIKIDNEKYSIDILGSESLVTMSPSCVDGKHYYWINSIFTHKPAKLSENMWILDLIKNTNPFYRKFDGFHLDINTKNIFIIIDNLHIESHFRFFLENTKDYTKKIKLLNGVIYNYDDNYYFMTNSSFYNYKDKKKIFLKLKEVISNLNPSCIIDLSIIYSNYLPPGNIFQITSCFISDDFKNYKYDNFFPDYVEINNLLKKTKYLINDTIMIDKYDNINLKNENYKTIKNNKIVIGSESIYISTLLSNYFNIPCLCIATTYIEELDDIFNIINTPTKNNILIKKQKENIDKLVITFISLF